MADVDLGCSKINITSYLCIPYSHGLIPPGTPNKSVEIKQREHVAVMCLNDFFHVASLTPKLALIVATNL